MMEHKAFVFRYTLFEDELRLILEQALATNECNELIAFIESNRADLRDPYEGEPLFAGWKAMIEIHDAHQYGDFALTKYYDPRTDVGLGPAWAEMEQIWQTTSNQTGSPFLGATIGPAGNLFDPGRMGSYFQSEQQVELNSVRIDETFKGKTSGAPSHALQLFRVAMSSGSGLYVTF